MHAANLVQPIFLYIVILKSMEKFQQPALITLTPELNPSAQRCLARFFTGDFASRTVHFVNICVKIQQIHQLFIQLINYVW
jgi:hypothetical protein